MTTRAPFNPPRHKLLLGMLKASACVAALLVPGRALATSGFPSRIRAALDAPSVLGCTLCHASSAGGGPVTQPFGQSMLARGLRPGDDASLITALQALEAEGTDSDGDGLGDIEELRMGLDPSFAGDASSRPPAYGCGAQVAPRPPPLGGSSLGGLALALAALAMRRRTRT